MFSRQVPSTFSAAVGGGETDDAVATAGADCGRAPAAVTPSSAARARDRTVQRVEVRIAQPPGFPSSPIRRRGGNCTAGRQGDQGASFRPDPREVDDDLDRLLHVLYRDPLEARV